MKKTDGPRLDWTDGLDASPPVCEWVLAQVNMDPHRCVLATAVVLVDEHGVLWLDGDVGSFGVYTELDIEEWVSMDDVLGLTEEVDDAD